MTIPRRPRPSANDAAVFRPCFFSAHAGGMIFPPRSTHTGRMFGFTGSSTCSRNHADVESSAPIAPVLSRAARVAVLEVPANSRAASKSTRGLHRTSTQRSADA